MPGLFPDGKTFADGGIDESGSNGPKGFIQLWDLTTDLPGTNLPTAAASGVVSLAFSPDGTAIADSGTYYDQSLKMSIGVFEDWSVSTEKALAAASLNAGPAIDPLVAFSLDGKVLFLSNGPYLEGVSTASFAALYAYDLGGVVSMAFSPGGDLMAYVQPNGTLVVALNPEVDSIPVKSVSVKPTTVVAGTSATGTVTLTKAAPSSGCVVSLVSGNQSVVVPSAVSVPGGATTASFVITTTAVSSSATAKITASSGSVNATTSLTVTPPPPTLIAVSLNPTAVSGGNYSTGIVTLSGIAGSAGVVVTLSSNNAAAKVPQSVKVPAGQYGAAFTVTTASVSTQEIATIAAKNGTVSYTASLTINPPTLLSVSLSPSTLAGGATSTGTVTLSGTAGTGGVVVKLLSNLSTATVPASVTVASGKSSATFAVKSVAVQTQAIATISASFNGVTEAAMLTITPPALKSLTVSPASVVGGKSSTGTVTISSPAPAAGISISLSGTGVSATVPATVTIASGKTSATFTVKTTSVTAKTSSTISATLGSSSEKSVLTIT